ncbi:MAG TPA: MtrB/PioB family decaheme-associated outer membrane protein [Rhodanobacter sp.]|nr:MtrB/PioB family decaheme-associated outer membrane protein [Rhodanobacter sp.]
MKSVNGVLSVKSLALAIMAVLPLVAFAQDDDVSILTRPTNFIEVGGVYADQNSAEFGQYNGLNKSRAYLLGNFSVRGGDAYGQGTGTNLWSIEGTDLGTTSRSLDATIRNQGKWMFGVSYDQLHHNIGDGDTYETPLQGSMGGNVFTMPAGFGVVSTGRPTVPAAYGTQVLTPAQQAFFHRVNVHSDRDNSGFTFGYNFNPQWNVQFNWNHVEQSGAKLIAAATDKNNTSDGFALAGYSLGGESIQIIMNPTDYTTDNMDLALNWAGAKAFFTVGYFGSRFRDNNQSVSFPNPYTGSNVVNGTTLNGAYPVDALSTMPNNNFNQANLSGGYSLTPTTKLVGGYSYGRNTQNAGYINQDQMVPGGLPVNSLRGRVIITHYDLKLTNQTTKDLSLSIGGNYNKRDNKTPSYTYDFFNLGGDEQTVVNIPLSYSTTKGALAADYRISGNQHLHAAYEYEKTSRWCNNALANNAQGELSATNAGYYTTASCVQVPRNEENKFVVNYRLNASDDLNFNAGYAYANRNATVNSSFYNPMQGNSEGFEDFGYRAFFDASRREHMLKAGANWQATQKLSFSLDGRGTYDDYNDSPLGVQQGHSASLNFDSTYAFSDKATVSAYASWQRRTRGLLSASGRNAVAPLPNTWTNDLTDKGTTVGFTAKRSGLMAGKLQLTADLSYSLDKTDYYTALNYTNASCTAPSNGGYNCGPVPEIRSALSRAKLTANYAIDMKSTIAFGYIYEKLNSNDYLYNYYQLGFTGTTTIPTNQKSPSYTENVLFVAYRYSFR